MSMLHERIKKERAEMRADLYYAIGDVHGMLDKFKELLKKIEHDAGHIPHMIIGLGDYIDRGPHSRETIEFLKQWIEQPYTLLLQGNHESWLANPAIGRNLSATANWVDNGGVETIQSYGGWTAQLEEDRKFIANLPIKFETKQYVFVHAGYTGSNDSQEFIQWCRPRDFVNEWHERQRVRYEKGLSTRHVVYGHTPAKGFKPIEDAYSTGLDTGACWPHKGGKLTAGVFDARKSGPPLRYLSV